MCSSNATCINTEGGYNCSCNAGYHGDGIVCNSMMMIIILIFGNTLGGTFSDTDECAEGTDSCDSNAVCVDVAGSYYCMCNPGFTGNGTICTGK